MKNKKLLFILCCLISLISLISFPLFAGSRVVEEKKPLKSVFIKKLQHQEMFNQFIYPTQIASSLNVEVVSQISGIVMELQKDIGSKTRSGERLLFIQQNDPIYQYKPMAVEAPISGVVNAVFVKNGQLVNKGEKLLTLVNLNKISLKIEIPVGDLKFIQEKMEGIIEIDDKKEGKEEGIKVKIVGIGPIIDPVSGTSTAELKIVDEKKFRKELPLLGAIVMVSFKSNIHKAFLVSEENIGYRGKSTFIMSLDKGNKVKRLEVTLGERVGGQVEIVSGVKSGEILIVKSSDNLIDGEEVKIEKDLDNENDKNDKNNKNKDAKK
ncbi:MAG: HlyD family efflux transporter periplasmic adaptor subunit [Oligoflexia bacterium]|nr:HlyD family efflux transporter periplasmic adaptor subunit [Oligoflexia bacterium]